MRAISVLLVILGHLGIPYMPDGHGVMIFFVISGFLITWLLLKENETTGTVSLRDFYIRRMLRLFPAFYVFWIVYVALAVLFKHESYWAQYFSAFFYVSNYYSAIVKPDHMALAHTWSLAVEEQFYVLWPWLFFRYRNDLKALTYILSSLIVLGWIYRLCLWFWFQASHVWMFCSFDTRMDQLAVGCLLAILLKRRAGEEVFGRLCGSPLYPLITLALLCASIGRGMSTDETYLFTVGFSLDAILIAVLLSQLIALTGSPLWKWLDSAPLRYVGRVSYGVYLYHWLVDWSLLNTRMTILPVPIKIVIAVGASVGLATMSYFIIEKPFLVMKNRFQHGVQPIQIDDSSLQRVP